MRVSRDVGFSVAIRTTSERMRAAGFYVFESVKAFLFDVSPRDPATFLVVPCVLWSGVLSSLTMPASNPPDVDCETWVM